MQRKLHILLVTTFLTSALFMPFTNASAALEGDSEEISYSEFTMASASSDNTGFTSEAVDENLLDDARGAFTPDLFNLNNAVLTGESSGNSVVGGVTGSNNIAGGSFTNTQGLVNVIQNSGNNVVIQSQTIVNMTMINN